MSDRREGSVNRLRAALLLAFVFGAGVVAGAALTRLNAAHAAEPGGGGGTFITVQTHPGLPRELVDLGLTAVQSRAIDSLLSGSRARVDSVMEEMAPRLQGVVDSVDQQVRALLSPAQRAALDKSRKGRQPVFLMKRQLDSGPPRIDTLRPTVENQQLRRQ